jgi:hypothetical protein
MLLICGMDAVNHKNNNKKLSKVLSTKLSIEDYSSFLMLTKLEYQSGLIKEESIPISIC